MVNLFAALLGMSMRASLVILAVVALRLCLRKAPRIFSYVLWFIVLARLLCPVWPRTGLSLLPQVSFRIESRAGLSETEGFSFPGAGAAVGSVFSGEEGLSGTGGVPGTDDNMGAGSAALSEEQAAGQSLSGKFTLTLQERTVLRLSVLWLSGVVLLLVYEGISYFLFLGKVKKNGTQTPFVSGIFRPRMYLPEGLEGVQKELVTEHEKIHIRRRDYLVKPLFFLACCIHWFNPLAWLAFRLMESDMEVSCDETVLQRQGYDRKKEYAYTLLSLCQEGGWKLGYPIAFGERDIKNRIKAAARAKKASLWVVGLAGAAVAAGAVFLVMDPMRDQPEVEEVVYLPAERIVEQKIATQEQNPEEQEKQPGATEQPEATEQPGATEQPRETEPPRLKEEEGEGKHSKEQQPEERQAAEVSETDAISLEEAGVTEMNYDPSRMRDAYEILLLPNSENGQGAGEVSFSSPIEGDARISDDYGDRIHPVTGEVLHHSGIDFAAKEGTPVLAAAEGVVVRTGFEEDCGNYVIVAHKGGLFTYYGGCGEILAEAGEQVAGGGQIASVGKTGRSTGAHLHFAVSKDGAYIRPVFREE